MKARTFVAVRVKAKAKKELHDSGYRFLRVEGETADGSRVVISEWADNVIFHGGDFTSGPPCVVRMDSERDGGGSIRYFLGFGERYCFRWDGWSGSDAHLAVVPIGAQTEEEEGGPLA